MYTKPDGVYDGDWKDNKRDGHGVYCYKSGSKYTGGWKGEGHPKCVDSPIFSGKV